MRAWTLWALVSVAFGQSFEAASIKVSPPLDGSNGPIYVGSRGGPGRDDPGRYTCTFCTLRGLITEAYNVPDYRLSAQKLPEDRYHVVATIAPGADRDQFRLMLQRLLAERFKVTVHREMKEMPRSRLVLGSGGAKLKPYTEGEPPLVQAPGRRAPGFYYRIQGKTMADFAAVLEGQLGRPVSDATGLVGKYDFDVWWSIDEKNDESPTIYSAIQSLGLKLENLKGQVEVVVVDHAQKPDEN